jgi:TonB family protein
MKKIILLTIGLISLTAYSQEKEMKYFNYKWKPTSEKKAKYSREILKQNDTLYLVTDYQKNGKLYMKGQYSSIRPMIENGFFEFYDFDNYKKIATGYYTNGEMTGDWNFTDYNGITRKVNYDLVLIYNEKQSDSPDSSSVLMIVEQMPKFKDRMSLQDFSNYIGENLVYPPMAQRYIKEDKVYVQFAVNKLGQISDIKVVNKVYKDLEREAVRVISQSPDWTPGYQKGKPVRVQFTFPINFELTR